IVVGEGEETLFDLLTQDNISALRGLYFRNGDSLCFNTYNSQLEPEEIPTPNYGLLSGNLNDYNFNISTMRGCEGGCYFCVNNGYWGKPRLRPIQDVIKELCSLESELDKDTHVHITDNL